MGTLFDGIEEKVGTFAAIHCSKKICYGLAKAANGGYQAIEEMGAGRLNIFAKEWDAEITAPARFQAFKNLLTDCFQRDESDSDESKADIEELNHLVKTIRPALATGNGSEAATQLFALFRKRPFWKLHRRELWRDAEKSINELLSERVHTMADAAAR